MGRKLRNFGVAVLSIAAFMTLINVVPPAKSVSDNPFIKGENEKVMIAAHRGGADTNPENTLLAYRAAVNEYKVDILESDLYLTKDGYLVYNHDSYVDETCNINGDISYEEMDNLIDDKSNRHYIEDYTLEELKQYNFGYYFKDKEGNRPYKDLTSEEVKEKGLQILEVEDLFKEFYETNKDLLFIVEIKNSGERGYEACDKLASALNKYPEYKDQIVIGTFNPEIETYLKETYPNLHRGASTAGAAGFVITEMLKVNLFNTNKFSCLQVPMSYDIKGIEIKLDSKMYINRAHRRNIAVQYWTINDKEEMKYLTDLGCDAIMTDDLDAAKEFIEEYYN